MHLLLCMLRRGIYSEITRGSSQLSRSGDSEADSVRLTYTYNVGHGKHEHDVLYPTLFKQLRSLANENMTERLTNDIDTMIFRNLHRLCIVVCCTMLQSAVYPSLPHAQPTSVTVGVQAGTTKRQNVYYISAYTSGSNEDAGNLAINDTQCW